jgi:CheY-like chemotaxis protein
MPLALIVEDDPEANTLLAMLLRLRGYETESAFRGEQAIELVKSRTPDVVFLDLMLPDMDGYAVCRLLKAEKSISAVPVVIVTARIMSENRIESFRMGADDYVPKPYTPDDIFDALDESQTRNSVDPEQGFEGTVPLDLRDDGQTLRALARLRRALAGYKSIGAERIGRVCDAIKAVWSSADRWARNHERVQVATLHYRLTTDALNLCVSDEAGWLNSDVERKPLQSASGETSQRPDWLAVAESAFDETVIDHAAGTVSLVLQVPSRNSALEDRE